MSFHAIRIDIINGISIAISVWRYTQVFCCQRIGLHEAVDVGGVGAGVEVVDVEAFERIEFFTAIEIGILIADI